MTSTPERPPNAVRGAAQIFAAESLSGPVGLVLVAILSRQLGLVGYGEFVLVVSVIVWIEWALASLFGRAALQLVAETDAWHGPAATLVWLSGLVGLAGGAVVFAAAPWIAAALGAPDATMSFRVLAADIPLFCLAQAHRQVAVGVQAYRVRALATAGRTLARLILILVLLQFGLSLTLALATQVAATACELLVARSMLRPGWWRDPDYPASRVLALAWPLFASTIAMRLVERLDLVLVQRLLRSPSETAQYGAAQQLALLPLLVSAALVPVLSAALARLTSEGRYDEAGRQLGLGIRAVLLLVPLAALAAGSGPDLAAFVFGTPFRPAGSLIGPLLLAFIGYVGVYVATAAFIASGHARWCLVLTGAMLAGALLGGSLVIPLFGGTGAAWVALGISVAGATGGTMVAARFYPVTLAWRPVAATLFVALLALLASSTVPSQGWLVLVELIGLGGVTVAALFVSRAVTREDVRMLRRARLG